jgi:hypothetical protein
MFVTNKWNFIHMKRIHIGSQLLLGVLTTHCFILFAWQANLWIQPLIFYKDFNREKNSNVSRRTSYTPVHRLGTLLQIAHSNFGTLESHHNDVDDVVPRNLGNLCICANNACKWMEGEKEQWINRTINNKPFENFEFFGKLLLPEDCCRGLNE